MNKDELIVVEPIRNNEYIADGAYVMALQEWAINNLHFLNKPILFPFIAEAHVQIGYFQNPEVEVNKEYVEKNNVLIVRRSTGGGAIFIDENSANFCFLFPKNKDSHNFAANYAQLYSPIVQHLQEMGAKDVVFSGKNDLTIDGKKISGAAMKLTDHFVYAGYSLLYDIDFEAISQVITPSRKKMEAKGISSVRQRVTKLKDYLNDKYNNLSIFDFKDEIVKRLTNSTSLDQVTYYTLTKEQWLEVDELIRNKYKNWDWVFGASPRYEYNREARFNNIGTINISLAIEQGRIEKCKISGDFFAIKNLSTLEEGLVNTRMVEEDLIQKLESLEVQSYFSQPITAIELAKLMLE